MHNKSCCGCLRATSTILMVMFSSVSRKINGYLDLIFFNSNVFEDYKDRNHIVKQIIRPFTEFEIQYQIPNY